MSFLNIFFYVLLCSHKSESTFSFLSTIGNINDPIITFSSGLGHLTIVSASNSNLGSLKVYQYNSTTNLSSTLYSGYSKVVRIIRQTKGFNNLSSNFYILQGDQFFVYFSNLNSKKYSQSSNTQGSNMVGVFGSTANYVYALLNNSGNCILSEFNLQQSSDINISTQANSICRYIQFKNLSIYCVLSSNSILQTKILIYRSDTRALRKTITVNNPQSYKNQKLKINNNFYCLSHGKQVLVYYTYNDASVCSIVMAQLIFDIEIGYYSLYISLSNSIQQYDLETCFHLSSYSTNTSMQIQITFVPELRLYAHQINGKYIQQIKIQDRYKCFGGCSSCINNYSIESSTKDCVHSSIFISNNNSSGNNTSLIINSTTFNSFVVNEICLITNGTGCFSICDYKCDSCSHSYSNCSSCSLHRSFDSENQCVIQPNFMFLFVIINLINTFRPNSIQSLFSFLDNISLYQYHLTNYEGIIQSILNELNFIQNLKWSLLPLGQITDWGRRPFSYKKYQPFTNQKYLAVERRDSLIFQTLKAFYTLFISFAVTIFFLFNRLFYCLFNYKISHIFRIYSFKIYLVIVIIVTNSSFLSYLFLRFYHLLFSLQAQIKLLHILSIVGGGAFVISLSMAFFYIYTNYGSLSKHFFPNTFRSKQALFYIFLRYSMRPLIEACLHIQLYSNPSMQLLSLCLNEFIFCALNCFFEGKFAIFRHKFIFVAESSFGFCMIIINFLLYMKHYYFEDVRSKQLVSNAIQSLVYLMMGIMIGVIVYIISRQLCEIFRKKKRRFKIQARRQNREKLLYIKKNNQKIQAGALTQIKRQVDKIKTERRKDKMIVNNYPIKLKIGSPLSRWLNNTD